MSFLSRLDNKLFSINPINKFQWKHWSNYSRLMVKSDGGNWSLDSDAKELKKIWKFFGLRIVDRKYESISNNQSIYYTSRYDVLLDWKKPNNRIAFPYYHGDPSSNIEFKTVFDSLCSHHEDIFRIQVTNTNMEQKILNSGINSEKVFRIPIGINLDYFNWTTPELCYIARKKLGIPQSAVVIGSFQKDGNGWGQGLDPKLIKGPDILLKTIKILKPKVSELFILLTGPARGYVKNGLNGLGVPYKHKFLTDYSDIGFYYNALDLYIITSREEGGPKALLESMSSGIPLITTKVGQAIDLVNHGINGWMDDTWSAEGLAHWAKIAIENSSSIINILNNARKTAEENSYLNQISLWKNFMKGFVKFTD